MFAHSVRVDKDDNIWAVDEGSNMVIKFSPQGKVLMLLGRRPESVAGIEETPGFGAPPPPAQPYVFNRQTDIAFDPAGNIFVPDGYGNSRVVKYDKNGRFVKAVGQRGSAPGDFNTPHTIAADAKGNVYVGDRGNARIQVFDNDLNLRAIYDNVGNPWAICISPGPHQYLYSSNSNPDNNNAASWAVTGEVYKMELDGKIIGKFGKAGKGAGEFSTVHQMDCRNENEIVTAEITAWRVQKIKLRPRREHGHECRGALTARLRVSQWACGPASASARLVHCEPRIDLVKFRVLSSSITSLHGHSGRSNEPLGKTSFGSGPGAAVRQSAHRPGLDSRDPVRVGA